MRAGPCTLVLLLLGPGSLAVPVLAQKSPPQQNITVVVVNELPQPAQPVRAVRVSLSYLESAVLITDAQQVTNGQGQAVLVVSGDAAQRDNLSFEITGAGDLVIYQPADGQLAALPKTVKISLLPKGSAALLGPAQIEAMLHRTLLQVNSLEKQVGTLKAEAGQGQQAELGAAIAVWAQANGFSDDQVNQQVEQWAQGIERQSVQATTSEQKALAELALKHYAIAAQLFNQASDADRQEIGAEDSEEQALQAQVKALEAAQQNLLDKQRSSLRQLLDHSEQAAGADQLNLKFHEATQTLESAEATAEVEFKKHTDNKGLHELFLRAVSDTANADRKEGEVAPADQSLPLLARAADQFQSLANEYSALGDLPDIAAAQSGLGITLVREGERSSGDKAMALLDQAVKVLQRALEVRTKAALPRDWAWTQNALGLALWSEGKRLKGDTAMALLDQAAQAFRSALEVRTKADLPQDWAQTEMNLGNVLAEEGNRSSGDKAMDLLDQAVQAFRSALEVYNKADLPQGWAWTEQNLAIALVREGERAPVDKAMTLLDQAVQAFRHALEIETKTDLPQDWARTESNLGYTLRDEGELTSGDKAISLFDQAVQAFRSALEVHTEADLPQDWATTQCNLGDVLVDEGEQSSGDKAAALLDQAVQAYRNALEVRTKTALPLLWAQTQYGLGNALAAEGQRAGGDKAAALLDQAMQAFRNALEVQTRADMPLNWAQTTASLMGLYHDGAFQFADALSLARELADFNPSVENRMNLLEAELTTAGFQECSLQAANLDDQALAQQKGYLPVRDVIGFACLWGATQNSAALAADQRILARVQADPSYSQSGWSFAGTLHFLSVSPAFANGRGSWIALFAAVQHGDSAGMTQALHQLEPLLQP